MHTTVDLISDGISDRLLSVMTLHEIHFTSHMVENHYLVAYPEHTVKHMDVSSDELSRQCNALCQ
jgi:hypothetical protein